MLQGASCGWGGGIYLSQMARLLKARPVWKTAVDFGIGGRAEPAEQQGHVGKRRTAAQWRQDFKVGQGLMSSAEQGWVQVTAGMSTMGEGDGKYSPHRKVTRARDESKTENDGYYGAGQDGNTRESRIGQMRRARRCSGVANKKIRTAREEEIARKCAGKCAAKSRVGDGSGRGAGDWAGHGGWEDDYYNGNIVSKELVRAVLCAIMIIISGNARQTKARGRCN